VAPKALNLRGIALSVPAAASFPKASPEHKEQARRLHAEGVSVENGRFHARRFSTSWVNCCGAADTQPTAGRC